MIIVLVLLNISVASASEINETASCTDILNQSMDNVLSSPDEEIPEHPDLIDKEYTYIYSSTVGNFFDEGVLDPKFEGKNLIFVGDFVNFGKLEINCDNVAITGLNANLKNTVFMLTGNEITLNGLNLNLDKSIADNKGSAIFVAGNDISLVNLSIKYIVPTDVEAYAILADGFEYGPLQHLRIMNSSIYFEGHNDNVKKYNCALKLTDTYDSVIENNTIATSLPLKNIDYTTVGANLDSAYVYSIGIEGCNALIFNNNTVISEVNKRPAVEYPTLDCFMISKSDDVIISNNSIYMTDFVTYPDVENYLYGIDVHNLKNLWIVNNSISMITTGGKMALGTAYPIQISGPIEGVVIEYNDLYSFSNGPNIGIYSQSYYGQTYLSIRYNHINVTGLAGTHDWALVTGIESQDTFAEIFNNEIEVHSIADVGMDDNLYAISYRQSIGGPNTFDIENNVAITDGYYAVYILNSQYSSIINNTLISFNDNVNTGDDAYRPGFRQHYYEDNYDNRVIRAVDYYSQRNEIDNENVIDISEHSSSNVIDIGSISGKTNKNSAINNPTVPNYNDFSEDTKKPKSGYVDEGSVHATILEDNSHQDSTSLSEDNQDAFNNDGDVFNAYGEGNGNAESSGRADATNVDGNNLVITTNSSSAFVGISSNPVSGLQDSSSESESQSVSKKAYEVEMTDEVKFVPSVFLIIVVLILLVIGYKHKREDI